MSKTMVEEPVQTNRTKPTATPQYGVYSEVGKLRKVMVCSPGLAHTRLTPTNCDELLFDDVLWVQNGKRDHFDFVAKMREHGVEVVEMHAPAGGNRESAGSEEVASGPADVADESARNSCRKRGVSWKASTPKRWPPTSSAACPPIDLPDKYSSEFLTMAREATGITKYLLPPLPNTLYTRDTTCWIYGGVTLNPLYWPVRRQETLLRRRNL